MGRIEIQKMYPDLLAQLVAYAHREAKRLYSDLRKVKDTASKLIKNGLLRFVPVDKRIILPGSVCGVDGSFYITRSLGHRFLGLIGLSLVFFDKGLESIRHPEINVHVFVERIKEELGIDPEKVVITNMLLRESMLINEASQKGARLIFIDGPIIDPPDLIDKEYVRKRVDNLVESLRRETIIVGIVKRFNSSVIASMSSIKHDLTDQDVVPVLFNTIYKLGKFPLEVGLFTNPILIAEENGERLSSAFKVYASEFSKKGYEFRIWTSFAQAGYAHRPFRVEILASDDEDIHAILQYIFQWISPGMSIPLPIYLAHYSCLIRKRAAQLVFSEALSRLASLVGEEDDLLNIRNLIHFGETS